MASTAQAGTPRHKRKRKQHENKMLTQRITTAKNNPFYVVMLKAAKAKIKTECDRKLEAVIQQNTARLHDWKAWHIESKRLKAIIVRLTHKLAFADRRLKDKDKKIMLMEEIVKRLEKSSLRSRNGSRRRGL